MKKLSEKNEKKVPYYSTILTCILSCIFGLLLPVEVLG